MGCQLEAEVPEDYSTENANTTDPSIFRISGNNCQRGDAYARKELTKPERTLTCTVAVTGADRPLVTAKTKGEVPKELLLDCMKAVKRISVAAPVKAGQTIIKDILRTGTDLVACEDVQ